MGAAAGSAGDGRSKKRPGVEEQRSNIVRAATALFAQRGARSVSIAQICARADVSRPTFYRCFADKAALVETLYEEAVNTHVGAVLHRSSLSDPVQLRAGMETMLEAIFERAELAQMLFIESADPASPAAQIIDKDFDYAATVLARDLRRRGTGAPSKTYLKAVMAAVQWIVQDAIRRGCTPKARREATDAACQLVIDTLGSGG
ncbi:MAG: TetR/AcrR family transcriptional regulator [Halioglobus sp.]|nr:TetR/AcrR family transcriptional regulator [Halioglobus sp.]